MTTIRSFYFPLVLAVGGMLFYHLAQKSIPKGINPFYATIIAYVVGIDVFLRPPFWLCRSLWRQRPARPQS